MTGPAWASDPYARIKPTRRQQEPWRSHAHVDIDRILYSPEFRRLAGVTQVVPPQVDYQFHDRLSHSVKVAQVASSLARSVVYAARNPAVPASGATLAQAIPPDILDTLEQWVDPDHCYVAGLAHDLGHPPFGHAGEVALQEYCEQKYVVAHVPASAGDKKTGDTTENDEDRTYRLPLEGLTARSFEGNAQSMRIVAALSFRRMEGAEFEPGLNLTYRSMAAIAKYPWVRGEHPHAITKLGKKWSFYDEEKEILDQLVARDYILPVVADGKVQKVHRWVESEIMDWADDISYAVHDLEDFFRAGLIPLHQIALAFRAANDRVNWGDTDFDFVDDEDIREILVYTHGRLRAIARDQLAATKSQADDIVRSAFLKIHRSLVDSMPTAPFSGTGLSHTRLRDFGSALITYLSNSAYLVYDPDIKRVQLEINPEAVIVAEFYKSLNKLFVIESAMLSTAQYGQSADIAALCESLFELSAAAMADFKNRRANRRLPPRLREYLRDLEDDDDDLLDESAEILGEAELGEEIDMLGDAASDDADADADAADDAWYFEYVMTRVIDYVCGLSDFQAAKLAQLLRGSADLSVLGGRWLDT